MAGIVMMLASTGAALTTGQVIVADGGFTLVQRLRGRAA
jgi:hypothetical protein